MISNREIAQKFYDLADLLEIEGANPFRVRAYRTAARSIDVYPMKIADMINRNEKLTDIPGVGKDLAQKITEIVSSGELTLLKETESKLPRVLNQLLRIDGLGPKRVKLLHDKLGINTIADLTEAIDSKKILALYGFGNVLVKRIKESIGRVADFQQKTRLSHAFSIVDSLLNYMKREKNIIKIDVAGSFRRRCEVVRDLDILVSAKNADAAIKHFLKQESIEAIIAQGKTRAAVRLRNGLQIDLRVVKEQAFGAALLYFTGSKDHNIALRNIAIDEGFKLNEYGLFLGQKNIAGKSEHDIYQALGLPYIEPELRESRGEIEKARGFQLPTLVKLEDVRGDLHVHTNETDGFASLTTMVKAARALGYEYVAITDHSQHLAFAKGLTEKRLLEQIDVINRLNDQLSDITILKSIEVDILEDGKLDLPNRVLKELDFTVCSIHSLFRQDVIKQTERVLRAMDNPYFTILGHATGRLINRRPPYELDLERIIEAAAERGCFLELNAQPDRLDINDIYCRMAKEKGVKLSISSDAHSTKQFNFMQFGVFQARRGWLTKDDVINTRSLKELQKLFNKA